MTARCAETSTCAPVFRRVSLDEAFSSFSLNQNDKTEVANYFKKYTVPSDYKKYPSWILFRTTEFVLNVLGLVSSSFKSKKIKLWNIIQIRLLEIARQIPGLGVPIPNAQVQIDFNSPEFKTDWVIAAGIIERSKHLADHLLGKFCSSAKRDSQGNITVNTANKFTSKFFTDVILRDKQSYLTSGEISFYPRSWP